MSLNISPVKQREVRNWQFCKIGPGLAGVKGNEQVERPETLETCLVTARLQHDKVEMLKRSRNFVSKDEARASQH